jgi:hypothetical protein
MDEQGNRSQVRDSGAGRRSAGRAALALAVAAGLAWGSGGAHAGTPGPSALELALAARPALAGSLSAATRAVLSAITVEEAEAIVRGETTLEQLRLPDGTPIAHFLRSVLGGGPYAIPFDSMDAGGGESLGAAYHLAGTMGQPDAAVAENSNAQLLLVGGFRGRLESFALFRDGFETSDSSRWSFTAP